MNYKAYLEQETPGMWSYDFVYTSIFPLMNMGYTIVPYTEFNHNPKIGDVIFGSVNNVQKYFQKLGINIPNYIGYPEELKEFYNRNIIETSMDKLDNNFPYFVKPSRGVKLFTGALIENKTQLDIIKHDAGNLDLPIYKSEPLDFKSEWRCFVNKGELLGIQFYLGDFRLYPDIKIIDQIISKYKSGPISYSLDVGVTDTGTWIVEINDAWSLGSYGLDSRLYTRFVIDRFRELWKNIIV